MVQSNSPNEVFVALKIMMNFILYLFLSLRIVFVGRELKFNSLSFTLEGIC
jgi:hypothetical protein